MREIRFRLLNPRSHLDRGTEVGLRELGVAIEGMHDTTVRQRYRKKRSPLSLAHRIQSLTGRPRFEDSLDLLYGCIAA